MSRISIRRKHTLSHDDAVAAADSIAAQLKSEYGMQSHWEGDTLHFERASASGTLRLAPKEVQLEVRLGFLLAAFSDSIHRAIERNLDAQLSAKRARPARRKG
ncbi:MAG: polyhydroxyalkanoic acid system family protein [Steroidobacteraceae bacterium]